MGAKEREVRWTMDVDKEDDEDRLGPEEDDETEEGCEEQGAGGQSEGEEPRGILGGVEPGKMKRREGGQG